MPVQSQTRGRTRYVVCLLPDRWTRYFENDRTDFNASWHKSSMRQGRKTVNFGVRRSQIKVTWSGMQIWTWGSGGGIMVILYPFGSSIVSSLIFFKIIFSNHLTEETDWQTVLTPTVSDVRIDNNVLLQSTHGVSMHRCAREYKCCLLHQIPFRVDKFVNVSL